MAQTYFGSTLRAGSGTLTDTVDGGFVVMMQTATVTTAAAGTATSVTEVLPAGSQIMNIFIDTYKRNELKGSINYHFFVPFWSSQRSPLYFIKNGFK